MSGHKDVLGSIAWARRFADHAEFSAVVQRNPLSVMSGTAVIAFHTAERFA
jgi:hypothetical protein